jgi:cardiolipin synthase
VDGGWAFVGSANWDPRSLRLNFELNLEVYDRELCARLDALFEEKREGAREILPDAWRERPLALRLRDGIARLALPYL